MNKTIVEKEYLDGIAEGSLQAHSLVRFTAIFGLIASGFLAPIEYFFIDFPLSALGLLIGTTYSVLTIIMYRVIGVGLMEGANSPISLFLCVSLKVPLFLGMVALLSKVESIFLVSVLIGVFSFIPACLLIAYISE